ncbi:hypothetical protein SUDANB178_07518 [Streptomyces sp. enrichment culture]
MVSSRSSTTRWIRSPTCGRSETPARRGPRRQRPDEQPLHDQVGQVSGEPVAVVGDDHGLGVPPVLGDVQGQRGPVAEPDDHDVPSPRAGLGSRPSTGVPAPLTSTRGCRTASTATVLRAGRRARTGVAPGAGRRDEPLRDRARHRPRLKPTGRHGRSSSLRLAEPWRSRLSVPGSLGRQPKPHQGLPAIDAIDGPAKRWPMNGNYERRLLDRRGAARPPLLLLRHAEGEPEPRSAPPDDDLGRSRTLARPQGAGNDRNTRRAGRILPLLTGVAPSRHRHRHRLRPSASYSCRRVRSPST